MLVLTITKDNCIRIGDQKIRISISPFEPNTTEVWIDFDDQAKQGRLLEINRAACKEKHF